MLTCVYAGALDPIPVPSIDWGDGTAGSCAVPLSSPFTCGPHAYAASGAYNAHVSAQSVCTGVCLCGTLECGPCANMAGGEYCDDVSLSAAAGVGGVSELADVSRAGESGWGWVIAAAAAMGGAALLGAAASLRGAR
jgi:hypothetical protein